MNSIIFESHAHYEDEAFNEDREALLASLSDNEIGKVVNVGSTFESLEKCIKLASKYDFIYAAIGIHPSNIKGVTDEQLAWVEAEAAGNDKVVSIGEIGLDYYWDKDNKEEQKSFFTKQIEIAKRLELPIIVHSRDAALDTYETMKSADAAKCGGVVHCFSYSKEEAAKYLDMGFYIGLGGVVTFKNAAKAKEVAAYVPLDRILLETDSPYLTPEPFRGRRNDSTKIPYIARKIAEIKGVDYETVVNTTYDNAMAMYKIKR